MNLSRAIASGEIAMTTLLPTFCFNIVARTFIYFGRQKHIWPLEKWHTDVEVATEAAKNLIQGIDLAMLRIQ